MLLRSKSSDDQLEFDPEIERNARRANSRNRRRRRNRTTSPEQTQASFSENSSPISHSISNQIVMANPPPRRPRTLGDYATQQGPWRTTNAASSSTTKAVEMKPAFLNLISANQFMGMEHEDPYAHLDHFYELCGLMGIDDDDKEQVYLKLFPFSLAGRAKTWLQSIIGHSSIRWRDLETRFLSKFFPPSRYISAKSNITTFTQGPDEPFCEAWERFKSLLQRCPNHGFEDIAQLSMFYNGLKPEHKMLLDAAAGGTMMAIDAEHATRIIEALASTDHQAQHNRSSTQRRGVLPLDTSDAILAQNKILTQQIEALTKQLSRLPQQIHQVQANPEEFPEYQEEEVNYMANQGRQGNFQQGYGNYQQGWRNNNNNPNQNFGWRQEGGPPNRQPPYNQGQPTLTERTSKLEDTFEKFMQQSLANQKNNEAAIRNLENQVGQIAKQIAEQQEGHFSANTKTNPKENLRNDHH